MKKTINILMLILGSIGLDSCNELGENPLILTNSELQAQLNENEDFKAYILAKQSAFKQTKQAFEELGASDREKLFKLYDSYNDYSVFAEDASTEDILFFEKVLATNSANSIFYFKKTLDFLTPFNYDREYLFSEIILSELQSVRFANGRLTDICDDIQAEVYVEQLNYLYYGRGFTLEAADRSATIAAAWAYVGCVRALYP